MKYLLATSILLFSCTKPQENNDSSCQSNSHYKIVNLDSGRISIRVPQNWDTKKKKDTYPETIFEQYLGNDDSSGVYIEVRKKHFANINELSSIIKDKAIHVKDDIKVIKENKIIVAKDTTFIIYYLDKNSINYAIAYNANIKNDSSISKVYYFHDITKNSKKFEMLVNNITKSITYRK